jgi:hypothetical protein
MHEKDYAIVTGTFDPATGVASRAPGLDGKR